MHDHGSPTSNSHDGSTREWSPSFRDAACSLQPEAWCSVACHQSSVRFWPQTCGVRPASSRKPVEAVQSRLQAADQAASGTCLDTLRDSLPGQSQLKMDLVLSAWQLFLVGIRASRWPLLLGPHRRGSLPVWLSLPCFPLPVILCSLYSLYFHL